MPDAALPRPRLPFEVLQCRRSKRILLQAAFFVLRYARAPASFETDQLLLRRVATAGGVGVGAAGECTLHLGAGAGAEAEASLVQEQVRYLTVGVGPELWLWVSA